MSLNRLWGLLIVSSACCFLAAAVSGISLLESLASWLMAIATVLVAAAFARGRIRRWQPARAAAAIGMDINADAGQARRLAQRIVAEAGTVGASVVVVCDGGADWGSAGKSGRRDLAVDPATRFEIGSLTKIFTGLLLADSVVRGEVSLDDPLDRHLPGFVIDQAGKVTLRSLATHTSGLPRLPRSVRLYLRVLRKHPDPYRGLDRRWLASLAPATTRQQAFSYSNFGYMLLGEALAEAAGRTWAELISERICLALAMTATSVYPDPRTARGHDNLARPVAYWQSSALPGAGALYSNTGDLRRFLDAQLNPDATPLGAAIKLSRTRQTPNMGLGWMLDSASGIVWHNGGTGGFGSFMAVSGTANIALATLTNSDHTHKLDRISMGCLREMTKERVR